MKRGRFGPYIEHNKLRAPVPRGTDMETVTLEMGLEWLAKKAAAPAKKAAKKKRNEEEKHGEKAQLRKKRQKIYSEKICSEKAAKAKS